VVTHLQTKYDAVVRKPDGSTVLVGLAYIPERAPLVPVSNPAIARWLPDTRFFTTFVETPHMEYQRVETLVSVRRHTGGIDVRSTLSPRRVLLRRPRRITRRASPLGGPRRALGAHRKPRGQERRPRAAGSWQPDHTNEGL
jgi:hypothetical protein